MLSVEIVNNSFIVFGLTWLGLKPTIYLTGTQTYDLPDWDSNLRATW
jgi:hypothetical protein